MLCERLNPEIPESHPKSRRKLTYFPNLKIDTFGRRANSVVQGARSQLNIGDQNIQRLTTLSHNNRSFRGSSSDESDSSNPPSQLNFEYLEHDQPFSREPLVDKVRILPSFICGLLLCIISDRHFVYCVIYWNRWQHGWVPWLHAWEFHGAKMSLKIPLRTFGLAKVSFWNPDEVHKSQKSNSLLRAADNWLWLLQVNHPGFRFFISYNTYRS
ncbi:hypothetical protein Gotur_019828 [Gossypium turneri]